MPLEIKELHIKATVDSGTQESGGASAPNGECCMAEIDYDLIIRLCVEKVLEILNSKNER